MLDENEVSQALLQILPNQTPWMARVPENVCFNKLALGMCTLNLHPIDLNHYAYTMVLTVFYYVLAPSTLRIS